MDKWVSILLSAENMWEDSRERMTAAEYPMTEQYRIDRDFYKAQRIYDLYGYEWFRRFIDRCPHIHHLLDDYVPCRKEPQQYQCTMFCHKYDFEKGCTLNATE
jgi:hypothetical protein